jgi:thiamine-monophosphate kinase
MNEQDFLELLAREAPPARGGEIGIGDDAALAACPSAALLVTVDAFVEGVHFPAWASPPQVAARCVRAALSDINAMGGTGRDLFAALGLPAGRSDRLSAFHAAFRDECRRWGLRLAGGDTVASPTAFLSLTVTGDPPPGRRPLTRSGGRSGDRLYLSGPLGRTAAALRLLERGWTHLDGRPVPPPGDAEGGGAAGEALAGLFDIALPYPLGRALALTGAVTACMDVSDGLSTDLARLAAASGCGAEVEGERLPEWEGLARSVPEPAERLRLLLHSGEEFALLFASHADLPYPAIGRLTEEKGLRLRWKGDMIPLEPRGYDHFRTP